MLDLGAVASKDAKTQIDTGKNLKIRAIALDFNVITRSVESQRKEVETTTTNASTGKVSGRVGDNTISKSANKENVQPNVGIIQNIANLLGVNLGGDVKQDGGIDDLSRLTGKSDGISTTTKKKEDARENLTHDVRIKYAKKLRARVEGGLAGVELANSKREEILKKGDAPGHLIARSIAAAQIVSTSGSMWLAKTGTGTLLTFLNQRSMKIALMPSPTLTDTIEKEKEGERMNNFTKQLPGIKFHLLIKGLEDDNIPIGKSTDAVLGQILASIVIPPVSTLVVSDRDDYLLAAKNRGMFTCRVRRKNKPRGNVTTSYTVADIDEIEDVINEVNGVSFNTVLSRS